MITATQTPYEFLARWNDGVLSGAHVKLVTAIIDDTGVQKTQHIEGEAQPVAIIAGQTGFPLSEILTDLQTGAITAMQQAQAAQAIAEAALAIAQAKIDELTKA